MNINCVAKCIYQKEGKCTLNLNNIENIELNTNFNTCAYETSIPN